MTVLAIFKDGAGIVRRYRDGVPVWSAGAVPPQDAEVNYPGAMSSWVMPEPPPAWQPPAGWSSADPHWDSVAAFLDFRRFIGLDQSERGISIDYVPERLPGFDDQGAVFAGNSGLVSSYSAALAMGDGDATIELFGVEPAGFVARAETAAGLVNWSVSHDGTGWLIEAYSGGAPQVLSIPDALPARPVDLALVRAGGTLRVYRDGALLTSAAAGAWLGGAATCRLVVAGAAAPYAALRIAGLRVTAGVARYAAAYSPGYPPVTTTRFAAGALRVAYGMSTGHSGPNIAGLGGRIVFGTTTQEAMIGDYDPAARKARIKSVGRWDARDDHNNPALVALPDGHLVYVGSAHTTNMPQITGKTATPLDAMSVDARQFQPPGITGTTYANVFRLEGEAGAPIYLCGRVGGNDATYQVYLARTYDLGVTWETVGYLIGTIGQRPYINMCKSSPTRLDFFLTYRHPERTNPGLAHFSYEGGAFRNSLGRPIGHVSTLPLDLSKATRVFDGTLEPANSWNQHIDRIGNRICFVGTVNDFTRIMGAGFSGYYIRGVYDLDNPGAWLVEHICHAGPGSSASPWYFPGACVDLEDEDVCYASVKVYGLAQQIVEFHRVSQGKWQAVRQITNGPAGNVCQRPRTIRTETGKYLTWVEIEVGSTPQVRLLKL